MGATGHLQHRVLDEEAHHRVQLWALKAAINRWSVSMVALPVPVIPNASLLVPPRKEYVLGGWDLAQVDVAEGQASSLRRSA
jgi:hypothetical protein